MPEYQQRELAELQDQETRLALYSFSAATAWDLGMALRTLAMKEYPDQSACISITHISGVPLFLTHTAEIISPAQMAEMDAIRNSVKRWEMSSWRRQRFIALGDIAEDAAASGPEYSTKGGGWPLRVKSVIGMVAMVVVSGICKASKKGPGYNPLKYDPPTDVNHEIVVKAIDMIIDKQ
ncbi:hypothetical protein BD779DRAFT_1476393 [Infundibulicybe gibba]|nr:hypothetical protein BD779DRAFT_1476393 [Infundibulicybe gibba]